MKNSALSILLLFGLGFGPVFGMLGGGDVHYGKDPDLQQKTNKEDGAESKETAVGTPVKKTEENRCTTLCSSAGESAAYPSR